MILARNGLDIPKEWYHDPLLTDGCRWTVAMHYALKEHNVPDQWKHDKLLKDNNG